MATYYALVRVEGTSTPQKISVEAGGPTEAKKLIEARLSNIKNWLNGPVSGSKPTPWF